MSVFCLSTSRTQTNEIVNQLRAAGFFRSEISVLFPYQGTLPEFVVERYRKAPGKDSSGGMIGTLGWLTGTAPLHIPGMDLLIGAGPILDAFEGCAADPTDGDLTGRFMALGIPASVAKYYDRRIRRGSILISTHAENATEVAVAREIFSQSKAENVCVVSAATVPLQGRRAEGAKYNFS